MSNEGSQLSTALLHVIDHTTKHTGLERSAYLFRPGRSPAPDAGKLAFGLESTANTKEYADAGFLKIAHTRIGAFALEVSTSDEVLTLLSTLDQQYAIIAAMGIASQAAGFGPVRCEYDTTEYDTSIAEQLVVIMRFDIGHDIHRTLA